MNYTNLFDFIAVISTLYGLLFIYKIRSYDLYEKEPIGTMIFTTIWGGIWSVLISLFLYYVFEQVGVKNVLNSLGAIFVIGPVEETSKLFALFFAYFFIKKDINEPTDGIIYISCVSLGFSLIENFIYITESNGDSLVVILRIFLCTPAHIIFSLFMGLAFYNLVKTKNGYKFLFITVILSSLAHGLYDLIALNGFFAILVLVALRFTYKYALIFLRYSLAKSPFRPTLLGFMKTYPDSRLETGLKCLCCGNNENKYTYRLNKILIQKCNQCGHYISTKDSLFYIFQYFGAAFMDLNKGGYIKSDSDDELYTLFKANFFSPNKNLAYFDLYKLNSAINEFLKLHVENLKKQFWYKFVFIK